MGLMVEQATERGIDAVEFTQDLAKSARGYVIEAQGHVTIVVDRANRTLVGAFMAGPAVSETIHEAVLAVKARIPVDVLADTIHAFPTTGPGLRHGLHRGRALPPAPSRGALPTGHRLMPTLEQALLLTALFFAAAVLYGMVGHAGASAYLAAMAFVGLSTEVMKPTALVLNILVAILVTARFARAGFVRPMAIVPFLVGSVPMAFVGGAVHLPGEVYRPLVGVVLIIAAGRFGLVRGQLEEFPPRAPWHARPRGRRTARPPGRADRHRRRHLPDAAPHRRGLGRHALRGRRLRGLHPRQLGERAGRAPSARRPPSPSYLAALAPDRGGRRPRRIGARQPAPAGGWRAASPGRRPVHRGAQAHLRSLMAWFMRPSRIGGTMARLMSPEPALDTRARPLHDLRISVTDRCNFRCVYCMPREVFGRDWAYLPREEILTYEEITRLAGVFTRLGVHKVRLTGGEPLVRRDLDALVRMLAANPAITDLTLTTNGSLLAAHATALAAAGLTRVTVSLDASDDPTFERMNDAHVPVARVLEGIEAAEAAGLGPVKVNMVVKRGWNEHAVLPMARRFRGTGRIVRFIEYMDVGHSNGWRLDDVVPASEILATIAAEFPLEPMAPTRPGRGGAPIPLRRWRRRDRPDRLGQPAILRRLRAGPAQRRRQALHLPLRRGRPRPQAPGPGRVERRRARRRACAACGRSATTTTRSVARRRPWGCPRWR